jgi:uncharacterized membrane protein YdjX (TVP38/TMEM64 family)
MLYSRERTGRLCALLRKNARLLLALAVASMLAVAYRAGLFADFSDPARAKATLLGLGPWGYVAFVLAYAALQPFGVPGTVFILVAPLIWPWPTAFALSMAGTMAASVIGFSFARFIARDWLAPRVPARFRRYDEALARRAFATVCLLRFLFWMPQALHIFFGVSRVSFATHFWGSLVGYTPPLLATSYFGPQVLDWMKQAPAWVWVALVGVTAVTATVAWRAQRRTAATGAASPPA